MQLYLHDSSEKFTLCILGSVSASDLVELESCWRTANSILKGRVFTVDLSGLTAADDQAHKLLVRMQGAGACLWARNEPAAHLAGVSVEVDMTALARKRSLPSVVVRCLKVSLALLAQRCRLLWM